MPRPSRKEERKAQILDAFERCVARFGVEGATLERVAEEAGLARALIRHNVGNREELLDALVSRFLQKSSLEVEEMMAALPRKRRLRTLISWLFDPDYSDQQSVLVADALISAGAHEPALAAKMRQWITDFVGKIEDEVRQEAPAASEAEVKAVAAGLIGLYFTVDTLAVIGNMAEFRAHSRQAAIMLLDKRLSASAAQ